MPGTELLAPLGCGVTTGAGAVLNAFEVGAGLREAGKRLTRPAKVHAPRCLAVSVRRNALVLLSRTLHAAVGGREQDEFVV